jgi:phage tail-like protein
MKRNEIEQLLPEVFRRTARPGSPLFALLEVMEALHAPPEAVLDQLDGYFDPYRAPERFVPFLARWVDLAYLLVDEEPEAATAPSFPGGLGRLRELVTSAARLSKLRGTVRGLVLFLEMATGISGFRIEEQVPGENGVPRPFHMRVRAPATSEPLRRLITQIIEMEKPAYLTYELVFD